MQEIAFQGFKLNTFSEGATLRCLEPSSNAPPLASGKPAPPLKDVRRSACPIHPVYILVMLHKIICITSHMSASQNMFTWYIEFLDQSFRKLMSTLHTIVHCNSLDGDKRTNIQSAKTRMSPYIHCTGIRIIYS